MLVDECHVTRVNQGLFTTTMEAEKRDPGNEVDAMHVHAQTFQIFFFYFRSMQVDIIGLSEAEDVKFIGDSSFKIIDGSVVVSRSDSISSSSSEEREDEMAFTANG